MQFYYIWGFQNTLKISNFYVFWPPLVVRHTVVELQPPVESRTSPTWGPSVLLYCTRHKTAGGVALSQAQACDSYRSPSSVTGFCSIVLHVSFYCRTRLSSGLTRRQERIQRKLAVDVANKFDIPLHQKVFVFLGPYVGCLLQDRNFTAKFLSYSTT